MKIYKQENVFDAAIKRVNYLFDEFENVVVGFSGGKDSTCVLNLALQVAEERDRLPLKVLFLDQEAEWQHVIDYVTEVMEDPRVEPMWFQIPLKLFNATSNKDHWLECWNPDDEENWMRPKVDYAYKDNIYGTDRFHDMFQAIFEKEFKDQKACYLAGVRTEESPARFLAVTSDATYKYLTFGKKLNRKMNQFTFYPIYDWSFTDVWKSIHDNNWQYTKIYDYQYMHGIAIKSMRVSNLHHETAVESLYYLEEIEKETWNKLTKRLSGINTAGRLGRDNFLKIKELPFMFRDWIEYRDHLVENLITDEKHKAIFKKRFDKMDTKYDMEFNKDKLTRVQINSILANDFEFTKLTNWERHPDVDTWRKWKRGITNKYTDTNRYING
jgi:predicted phosphoadenosine phosphosulfate sulfurtransferase